MAQMQQPPDETPPRDTQVDEILSQLDELEETMTSAEQRTELEETRELLQGLPGSSLFSERIDKYTSRDLGEAMVGSIIFALPLLVEDGVFDIAGHFVDALYWGIPVFLVANVLFVMVLTAKLLYVVDIREVAITNPIFGLVPRRLVGVLGISLLTTTGLMVMWGRTFEGSPSTLEMFGRITVIWAAAALGATLGDILPGESKGTDLTIQNVGEMVTTGTTDGND